MGILMQWSPKVIYPSINMLLMLIQQRTRHITIMLMLWQTRIVPRKKLLLALRIIRTILKRRLAALAVFWL